jgi:transcriptional regulator with XRE-family HTH domain
VTSDQPTPGRILTEARERHGVSQRRLAIRAGTTQSAISRIERDKISPSVETLRSLLHLLGEDLVLGVEARDFGVDPTINRGKLRLMPAQRVEHGLAFSNQVWETRQSALSRTT